MNGAFVAEWNPRDKNKIFDVRVQQTPVYGDNQTNISYNTDGCSFIVQNTNFSWTGTGTVYCYPQKNSSFEPLSPKYNFHLNSIL